MADAVTATVIENGPRNLVARFTNFSDGTGEAGVVKVNAASANGVVIAGQTYYPGVNLKITRAQWVVSGMSVRVQWVATTNADALILSGTDHQDYRDVGGITNPGTSALPGSTGSIAFTTSGQTSGSNYTITLWMTKGIPQA